jgi:hypothetical protein
VSSSGSPPPLNTNRRDCTRPPDGFQGPHAKGGRRICPCLFEVHWLPQHRPVRLGMKRITRQPNFYAWLGSSRPLVLPARKRRQLLSEPSPCAFPERRGDREASRNWITSDVVFGTALRRFSHRRSHSANRRRCETRRRPWPLLASALRFAPP